MCSLSVSSLFRVSIGLMLSLATFLGHETFGGVGVFSFVYVCFLVLNKFALRLPSD